MRGKKMITFTKKEDNKQYVSISVSDNTNPKRILNYICCCYSTIDKNICIFDSDEILLPLENNINYDFSLNDLRKTVSDIAEANISHFCVDLNLLNQRCSD